MPRPQRIQIICERPRRQQSQKFSVALATRLRSNLGASAPMFSEVERSGNFVVLVILHIATSPGVAFWKHFSYCLVNFLQELYTQLTFCSIPFETVFFCYKTTIPWNRKVLGNTSLDLLEPRLANPNQPSPSVAAHRNLKEQLFGVPLPAARSNEFTDLSPNRQTQPKFLSGTILCCEFPNLSLLCSGSTLKHLCGIKNDEQLRIFVQH